MNDFVDRYRLVGIALDVRQQAPFGNSPLNLPYFCNSCCLLPETPPCNRVLMLRQARTNQLGNDLIALLVEVSRLSFSERAGFCVSDQVSHVRPSPGVTSGAVGSNANVKDPLVVGELIDEVRPVGILFSESKHLGSSPIDQCDHSRLAVASMELRLSAAGRRPLTNGRLCWFVGDSRISSQHSASCLRGPPCSSSRSGPCRASHAVLARALRFATARPKARGTAPGNGEQ